MYARIINIGLRPDKIDEFVRIFHEQVAPAAQQQKGFKGMTLLLDSQTHNAITISLWESELDIIANEKSGYYREQLAKIAPLTFGFPVDQHYEVLAQVEAP
jgi:heme-degrading monooxygenase HmoA